ncbi:MAG TPA: hypothetical protein VNI54_03660 [Thermoanaerobaculia bacterium]|nr:hypothetical protein [Thermoanaerobaculia bacterium]
MAVLESELDSLAAEAVAMLQIAPPIEQLRQKLFQQIEECDVFAASNDALFITTSLPLANALIHYAAEPTALNQARVWARVRWPHQDPTSMLATLTLIYVVQQGVKSFAAEPQRNEMWDGIHRRIETLLQAEPSEAAVA